MALVHNLSFEWYYLSFECRFLQLCVPHAVGLEKGDTSSSSCIGFLRIVRFGEGGSDSHSSVFVSIPENCPVLRYGIGAVFYGPSAVALDGMMRHLAPPVSILYGLCNVALREIG